MILDTQFSSTSKLTLKWLKDLALGGMLGPGTSTYLLSTDPLVELLKQTIDFDAIEGHMKSGLVRAFALSATNYQTGTAITFFDGAADIKPWTRSSRLGRRARLTLDHVMASAAIPILFQPVKIDGSFYGDGSIRLRAPISPAIHLGADRVLAIGIRYYRANEETEELNRSGDMKSVSVADIAGILMNATFMDSLEADVERVQRINQTLAAFPKNEKGESQHPEGLRPLKLLVIHPSQDLGLIALDHFQSFPKILRYLLSGLGASDEKGWDLLSYLAFDGAYTGKLLELGYQDAMNRKAEILDFFETGPL